MNEHTVTDPYGIAAGFYDPTAAPYRGRLRGTLFDAFAGANPSADPVLGGSAGTKLSTEAIAHKGRRTRASWRWSPHEPGAGESLLVLRTPGSPDPDAG